MDPVVGIGRDSGRDVTCVVIDDQPPIVDSVTRLLAGEEISVVATAAGGAPALDAVERERPTVCIVGVQWPRADGFGFTRSVRDVSPETAVIIFSSFADSGLVSEALDAGARGVALKRAPLGALLRAVDVVTSGGVYVDAELGGALVAQEKAHDRLSQREREILSLLAHGNSYPEIGALLSVSTATVRSHAQHAIGKLGARNRTQAVALALRGGMIG